MTRQHGKIIFLASIGGTLEFFDFTIYALFAAYISRVFFPHYDSVIALIQTFAVFALGYLARPVGGVFFGHIGDKKGRRCAFSLAVLCMAASTLFIGLLPGYNTWGSIAPLLLIVLRLLQGFSVGGEIPAATIFTFEHMPKNYRGLALGIIFMCITLGNALAGILGFILVKLLSQQAMLTWGWRIPFFIGCLLSIIGYILRRRVLETPVFERLQREKQLFHLPVVEIFMQAKRALVVSFLLTALSAATIFIFLYLPTYLTVVLHYADEKVYLITMITFLSSFIAFALCCPLFGSLSDKLGRKPVLITGCLATIIIGWLLFKQLIVHAAFMPWLFGMTLGFLVAMVNGCYGATISEQFTPPLRASGMGLSYNTGFALFGGLAPLVATLFIKLSGSAMVPYYYLLVCALLTLIASVFSLSESDVNKECEVLEYIPW